MNTCSSVKESNQHWVLHCHFIKIKNLLTSPVKLCHGWFITGSARQAIIFLHQIAVSSISGTRDVLSLLLNYTWMARLSIIYCWTSSLEFFLQCMTLKSKRQDYTYPWQRHCSVCFASCFSSLLWFAAIREKTTNHSVQILGEGKPKY